MVEYVVPLMTLLVSVLATLLALRFMASRQWLFWVLPLLLSAFLTENSLVNLFSPAYALIPINDAFKSLHLIIAILWLLIIMLFHYALKEKVSKNRYRNDQRKNYEEALFIEKAERRAFRKRKKRIFRDLSGSAYKPELQNVESKDLDKFDN